jgi:hypothetical protein
MGDRGRFLDRINGIEEEGGAGEHGVPRLPGGTRMRRIPRLEPVAPREPWTRMSADGDRRRHGRGLLPSSQDPEASPVPHPVNPVNPVQERPESPPTDRHPANPLPSSPAPVQPPSRSPSCPILFIPSKNRSESAEPPPARSHPVPLLFNPVNPVQESPRTPIRAPSARSAFRSEIRADPWPIREIRVPFGHPYRSELYPRRVKAEPFTFTSNRTRFSVTTVSPIDGAVCRLVKGSTTPSTGR